MSNTGKSDNSDKAQSDIINLKSESVLSSSDFNQLLYALSLCLGYMLREQQINNKADTDAFTNALQLGLERLKAVKVTR